MTPIDAEEIKAWFEKVIHSHIKWTGLQGETKCPLESHGGTDSKPSFSLNAEKGVWTCHTEKISGGVKDLADRLKAPLPASWSGLGPKKQERKDPLATYDYRGETGELLYQVLRYEPKRFSQRRPDGSNGWIWNLDGVQRVPYRLPALKATLDRKGTVFIVEGEKDADSLASLGLQATCNSGGAGKWTEEYSKTFSRGDSVVIFPDQDEAGRKHGESVARSLKKRNCRIKLLPLPGLPEKGDVSDWLKLGHGKEELLKLVELAPEWEEEHASKLMSHLRPPDESRGVLPEMIGGLFPRGYLSVITAHAGAGKTWLLLRLACDLSCGGDVLEGLTEHDRPMKVLFLQGDYGPGLMEARLKQTGFRRGDGFQVLYKSEVERDGLSLDLGTAEGQENMRLVIERFSPDIVILDTLSAFHVMDENDNTIMKPIFSFCSRLAEENKLAFVVAHHARKPKRNEVNLPLTQHETVGASVLQRMVGYLIGMEAREEEDRKAHVVRVLKCWFRAVETFAFFLEDGEEDDTGFPTVLMRIELAYDPKEGDKTSRLWGIIQDRYGDGKPFTRGMLERWTEGLVSGRSLKSLLPRLVKESRLDSYGTTKNRQYQVKRKGDETDPFPSRAGVKCANEALPVGNAGVDSNIEGVKSRSNPEVLQSQRPLPLSLSDKVLPPFGHPGEPNQNKCSNDLKGDSDICAPCKGNGDAPFSSDNEEPIPPIQANRLDRDSAEETLF